MNATYMVMAFLVMAEAEWMGVNATYVGHNYVSHNFIALSKRE